MLYHKLLGFPRNIKLNEAYNLASIVYTEHALQASKNDRYGNINLPETISFQRKQIVEIETNHKNKIEKLVVRVNYDNKYDLTLAILVNENRVKTVWLNDRAITGISL